MGLTSVEAAKVLGVTPTQITRLCKVGTIKARKHGPVWDIDPDSVEAYKNAPKAKGGRPRKSKAG